LVVDSLAGYVCRVSRLAPLKFPEVAQEFSRRMLPITEVVYKAKLLMEKTYSLLINDQAPLTLGFADNSGKGLIPPCKKLLLSRKEKLISLTLMTAI
jgi:hypothetical protein